MSDSIIVRVTRDSYDMASTGQQTQVYVQIPEVGRVSWLLPAEMFHPLKDRAWPEVLDVTDEHIVRGEVASNSSSTAAWRAIREWLAQDANRDEVQVAFEEERARLEPRSAARSADKLTALFAPTQALREDPHDGPLHHDYRVGRDLPELGGA
ncbi:hypothetical protein ACJWDR_29165 [Streptomyces tauricus]|uniref:hypothetical protein n=1 Tax=Streptomyces tauricus TaxID=68274 RepID=UPI00387EF388